MQSAVVEYNLLLLCFRTSRSCTVSPSSTSTTTPTSGTYARFSWEQKMFLLEKEYLSLRKRKCFLGKRKFSLWKRKFTLGKRIFFSLQHIVLCGISLKQKVKASAYIAQYPVLRTAQSTLQFTSLQDRPVHSQTPSRLLWEASSHMLQLRREGCSYTYPPLCIAKYSFI